MDNDDWRNHTAAQVSLERTCTPTGDHDLSVAQVLEAIIRGHGGGLSIHESRMTNLSGKLVITKSTGPNGEEWNATLFDVHEGRYNPVEKFRGPIITDTEMHNYVNGLTEQGITVERFIEAIDVVSERRRKEEFAQAVLQEVADEIELRERRRQKKEAEALREAQLEKPGVRRVMRRGR